MNDYFADLHIHIGAGAQGEPVKITASNKLTFPNILQEAANHKGLDMIGIIDCASPIVIRDMERMLLEGEMEELAEGGIKYNQLVVIPGAEVESREENGGQAHYLAYFPFLEDIKEFSKIMKQYITNINLSSQATGLTGKELLQIVDTLGGILIPAHVFTPHKSFYGRAFTTYREVFSEEEWARIPAVELGLSADTYLADYLEELSDKTYLSNSDAHSLPKIAREYNRIRMENPCFKELKMALAREKGRRVVENYGLDPRMGKYHRTYCLSCAKPILEEKPVLVCPICGTENVIIGVKDRIMAISSRGESISPTIRPNYVHQIPLLDVPGVGAATLKVLLKHFKNEMHIIHKSSYQELEEIVGRRVADNIEKARSGNVFIKSGGGGVYGKVMG